MLLRTIFSIELMRLGLRNIQAHKLRSMLTALGIIFGVGAVVCMLSIGEGASAQSLAEIRLLGSENIILRSVEPPASQSSRDQNTSVKEYGLRMADVERLRGIPFVRDIVLLREVSDTVTVGPQRFTGKVLGTTENYFSTINLRIARGRTLNAVDDSRGEKVCVIGADVAEVLFPAADPLGKTISVDNRGTGPMPYLVVGVLDRVLTAGNPRKGTAARNVNADVYLPMETVDRRYGTLQVKWGRGTRDMRRVEFSDIYVAVAGEDHVIEVSKMVQRALDHGRREEDYAISVPLELLMNAEKQKRLWQAVLGSIGGISLLVGGIGIMNIMLATVTERTREIGIRRALGAKRYHITAQFLIETVILSLTGGLVGIGLGIGFALLSAKLLDVQAVIAWWAVVLSFFVSAAVGISFGLYPARAAAALDPIEALRHE